MIVKIVIDNAGKNYTSGNTEKLIVSPPFAPKVSIRVSKVKVTQKVVLGRKYQLEAPLKLAYRSPGGQPFTAMKELIQQEFDVEEVGRYFRIREVK